MLAERFRQFYAAVNDGHDPYPWQVRLMEQVAADGRWPASIAAPTGAGKTSVVDIHVFLNAEFSRSQGEIARPPRRLVLVAPRRVLVDDQYERACELASALRGGSLSEYREALGRLTSAKDPSSKGSSAKDSSAEDPTVLRVTRLRGGADLDLEWRLDPTACQIISSTPQMWGSRLLFRGYRSRDLARNLETGLLTNDVVVIVDEAHLHDRMMSTARRLLGPSNGAVGASLVAMTATPTEHGGDSVRLGADDEADTALARRVHAPKTVVIGDVIDLDDVKPSQWQNAWKKAAPEHIARAARDLPAHDGTAVVFVNTVETAVRTAEILREEAGVEQVPVVCGRMRPFDLDRLRAAHDGLLDPRGCDGVPFLVSTQSLEVGVDLDVGAMVSELAPASAMAQRLGRLNRSGKRSESTFCVVAPTLPELDPETLIGPYTRRELAAGRSWLDDLGGEGSPARVSSTVLPIGADVPVPAVTAVELRTVSRTSDPLAADPDPDFYLEDPCRDELPQIQICARDVLAFGPDAVSREVELVRRVLLAAPPRPHELATLRRDSDLVRKILAYVPEAWVIRSEAGALTALRYKAHPKVSGGQSSDDAVNASEVTGDPRPGDILVVPAGARILSNGIVAAPGAGAIDDVLRDATAEGDEPPVLVDLRDDESLIAEIATIAAGEPSLGSRSARDALADALAGAEGVAGSGEAARLLRRHRYLTDLAVTWACEPHDPDDGVIAYDGVLILVHRPGTSFLNARPKDDVLLEDHCRDVAVRAAEIVDHLDGLVDPWRDDLVLAARWHDCGKAARRFQRRMGTRIDERGELVDPCVAKSRPGAASAPGDGWRHEQLSAAMLAATHPDRSLATVVIAAHHGHGRAMFDRQADDLLDDCGEELARDEAMTAAAQRLFGPLGEFEMLRERVTGEHGAYAVAYVEALLRCVDMQVSREETKLGGEAGEGSHARMPELVPATVSPRGAEPAPRTFELPYAGDLLLSHLAAYGVLVALDDAGIRCGVSFPIDDLDMRPRIHVPADVDDAAIAALVARTAERTEHVIEADVDPTATGNNRRSVIWARGTFSADRTLARIPVAMREELLAQTDDPLVVGLLAALGCPNTWGSGEKLRPHTGATKLDGVLGNHTSDFVRGVLRFARTAALSPAVPLWERGDEADKTGWAPQGTSARLDHQWLACLGLTLLPVAHRANDRSETPATWSRSRGRAGVVLPVPSAGASVSRLRALVGSRALKDAVEEEPTAARARARSHLRGLGVSEVMFFSKVDRSTAQSVRFEFGPGERIPL